MYSQGDFQAKNYEHIPTDWRTIISLEMQIGTDLQLVVHFVLDSHVLQLHPPFVDYGLIMMELTHHFFSLHIGEFITTSPIASTSMALGEVGGVNILDWHVHEVGAR
jgi:hypothetical protein